MTTHPLAHRPASFRLRPLAAGLAVLVLAQAAFAQQPGAGRGAAASFPRTDAMAPLPAAMASLLTTAQQDAIDALSQPVLDLTSAANGAKQALTAASLALPANGADLTAKAGALAAAEQALAAARADTFAKFQSGPNRVSDQSRSAAIARLNAGRGGRGGGLTGPKVLDDDKGFAPIFDGKTLTNWDGDPKFWRAENGSLIGESTPENRVTQNTFLIWRGGTVKDFELKAEFRISETNSGIQYRSKNMTEVGPWVVGGYQADMDFANNYPGQLGEERGRRNIMVQRGEAMRIEENDVYKLIGTIGTPAEIANSFVPNGWNTYHIIAKGNILIHILNGRVSILAIDEDDKVRAREGIIALQMHTGNPFKVEYRNLRLKVLSNAP
jgi:hypothetical protein